MIYWLLFYEFFKIGLFAIGGGLVTVPFLFDLTARYDWFTTQELADMIAVSESTPGPLGVNMATYVGYSTAGIGGALAATVGLVAPSVIIIVMIAKLLRRFGSSSCLQDLLGGVRPAVLALILFAGIAIAKLAWVSLENALIGLAFLAAIHWVKGHPIVYICLGAIVGLVLRL